MDQYSLSRRFRLSGWHIGLLLVIGFVALAVLFVLTGRNSLKKELTAIRDAGYPTNYEELDKYYSIPEGVPNAAEVYSKAFDAYQWPTEELEKHLPILGLAVMADPRGSLDPNSVKAIISNLQSNKETLEFLDKAAAIEHCRYDLYFDKEGILENPFLGDIRNCAQFLAEQTLLLAHQGDGDAAVKTIARQLAQAQSLKKEPLLFSQMEHMLYIGISLSSMEYTLNRTTLTDEQLAGLQQQLSHLCQDDRMATAFISERCWVNWLIDKPEYWELPTRTTSILFRIPGLKDKNFAMLLKLYGQFVDAMKLSGRQRLLQFINIWDKFEDLSDFYLLTKRLMPAIGRVLEIDVRTTAQVDCARVALGIERYRLAKGSLPKELADLVPRYMDKVPIDPLDDKPLRYKLTEPGYIVYSIGYGGTDEGGRERGSGKDRSAPHDWPFIVEH
jgi:hypothetical protein